jgi:Phage integrase, N-terminal SAM-like domain
MPPMAGTRATFAVAAGAWLRHVEHDCGRTPTTVRGYQTLLRTHVLPEFGAQLLTDITTEHVERWVWGIDCSPATRAKLIVCLSGIYRRARPVWGVSYNPVEDVERPQLRPTHEVNVYTPAEVLTLVAAADLGSVSSVPGQLPHTRTTLRCSGAAARRGRLGACSSRSAGSCARAQKATISIARPCAAGIAKHRLPPVYERRGAFTTCATRSPPP